MFLKKLSSFARHYSNKQQNVVIVGAVRSPFHSDDNSPASQQATRIIDEVIKRACLPKADIDEVQLVGLHAEEAEKLRGSCDQLHKSTHLETAGCTIKSLSNAIEKLNETKVKVVVVCGLESKTLAINGCPGDLDSSPLEIMPILNRVKRCSVAKDEFANNKPVSVATAIALTSLNYSTKLNINPLASLTQANYNAESDTYEVLRNFLETKGIQKNCVHRWEFLFPKDIVEILKTRFELDVSKVNKYNLNNIIQQMPSIAPTILLTHLVHNLQRTQSGCIGVCDENHLFSLMFLKKLFYPAHDSRPVLTLYTKACCPLCDELIEELEQNFKDQYQLEKVYIDRKENVRFLRLYRNDIPVLFLNGQFLCMHRLDKNLLHRQLSLSNKEENVVI